MAWAFAELEQAGYTVASAYTAVKDKRTTALSLPRPPVGWRRSDRLGRRFLRPFAGVHYQNRHDFEPYIEAVRAGRLPAYRAMTPNADERLIREFILQLKLGRVSCDYFQEKFGVDVRQRFAGAVAVAARPGVWRRGDGVVRLNRDGLLQVDRLLHEFFLPEHKNARIRLKIQSRPESSRIPPHRLLGHLSAGPILRPARRTGPGHRPDRGRGGARALSRPAGASQRHDFDPGNFHGEKLHVQRAGAPEC